MKARMLLVAIMAAFASFASAQEMQPAEQPEPDPRIVAHVNEMAEKLLLSDSKKAKFIPLYQTYLQEKAACRPQCTGDQTLTDSQLKASIKASFDARELELKVDRKYFKKLSRLLTARQLDMVYSTKEVCGKCPQSCKVEKAPAVAPQPVAPATPQDTAPAK